MKTELLAASPSSLATELLAVFAVDQNDQNDLNHRGGHNDKTGQKDRDPSKLAAAKAEPVLLTSNAAILAAAGTLLASGEFKAGSNETVLLHAPAGLAAKRLLIVGLGRAGKTTVHDIRKAAGTAVRFAKPRAIRELTILLPDAEFFPELATTRAALEGAIVADYDPDTYRTDRKDQGVETIRFLAEDPDGMRRIGFDEGIIVGESQNFARTLVNEPGNYLTPTVLGERASAMAREVGLKVEVHGEKKLHELKMGAFWSVSQGSAEPPALIVLTYEPEGGAAEGAPVLGLVGKGITFDTGGISIKPADGMEKMKYDMAGGAAMIGAMRAIAHLKPSVKVISVVCAAENMPDGKAFKPGDVVTAMSGKTIEIINTDAEGRLVLADGLNYAKQLGATHLIDAATLTGACVVALGIINAGGFSNDDDTYARFHEALQISGEKFWRLPAEDDYKDQIKSQIADIMNTGGTRYGGAITAAMFLKEFVEDTPWIHLDIAGMAWIEDQKPWIAKGPSGFAVRSITEWVRSYSN